ncbi:hypothetical protein GR11A_00212 [Vibrio phage vB_VcorM_GR11A]|nr:hypothetical protein GR11A_00212 [Vibrio phage vB_VcorM_GR11A]
MFGNYQGRVEATAMIAVVAWLIGMFNLMNPWMLFTVATAVIWIKGRG